MSFLNTKKSGRVRNIIYKDKDGWFGVALELNIVETGDSPQEVMLLLDNAIQGYIESTQKSKLSIGVLNQEVDPEFEELWKNADSVGKRNGKEIYSFSSQPLRALMT